MMKNALWGAAFASVLALVSAASASAAGPGLARYRDWSGSPEFVLLATDEEKQAWREVATDDEAERFVALFWARRNPEPGADAAANPFRRRFETLVKLADDRFTIRAGARGALTERGRLFILLGPPKSIAVVPGSMAHAPKLAGAENEPGTTLGESLVTFTYEAAQIPRWAGSRSLVATFAVEQTRDSLLAPSGEVRRIEKAALAAAVVAPGLREAPAAAIPAVPTLSGETARALEAALAGPEGGEVTLVTVGRIEGTTRLMVQAFFEREAPDASWRLAWLVRARDGREAARGDEPLDLQKSPKGPFADHAFELPPGDWDVAVVVLDGAGCLVRAAHRAVSVAPFSPAFRATGLFLASVDVPADPLASDAPFVFAGRKFVSRGGGRVAASDGLLYVMRIHAPGYDPATRQAFLKTRVKVQPKGKKPIELGALPDEPVTLASGANGHPPVFDLVGSVADVNIGEYFRPGEYLLIVTVEDTIRKETLEASQPFTVVGGK